MTEVKKKNYVSPSLEVYEVESTHLLVKSTEASREEALAKKDVRINHQKKIQAVSLTDGMFW